MNKDYIKPFTEKFKIYLFKKRKRVKMTVMMSETYGITYLWNQEDFESMITNWQDEWEGKALGTDIFIGPKPGESKRDRFVRFSAFGTYGNEHRFSYNDMEYLHDEYFHQKQNVMPWDK